MDFPKRRSQRFLHQILFWRRGSHRCSAERQLRIGHGDSVNEWDLIPRINLFYQQLEHFVRPLCESSEKLSMIGYFGKRGFMIWLMLSPAEFHSNFQMHCWQDLEHNRLLFVKKIFQYGRKTFIGNEKQLYTVKNLLDHKMTI